MSRRRVPPLAILLLCLHAACGFAIAADNTPQPPPPDEALPPGAIARFGSLKWRTPDNLLDLAISADGKRVAAIHSRGIVVWDVPADRELFSSLHKRGEGSVSFSPNDQFLAASYGSPANYIQIWNIHTGKEVAAFDNQTLTPYIRFAPDSNRLLFTGPNFEIIVWDLAARKKRHAYAYAKDHLTRFPFALSPSGRWLAITESLQTISIVDFETTRQHTRLEHGPSHYAFSNDDRMLAVTRLKTMELFEIKTGKLRHQIPKELEWSFQQFAPNNKKMAFCVIGGDGVIVWLDPFTGKLLDSWEGHKKAHMLRISQDGRTAVSGGSDGTVHVWDIGTGKTLRAPDKTARAFHFLAYAPDDKTVLAACSDFHFLDATTLAEQARIELDVSGSWTTAISPDGKTVAFRKYQDKKIVIVDTKSRKVLRSLESAASGTMTFGPDSNTLYHQCLAGKAGKEKNESQRTIRVWNTATGLELTPLYEGSVSESFPDMSISSQGKLIVAAATPGEKTILRIWDLATGKEEDQLDIEAKSVMFSHEGDILAASNDFGVIKFIDLKKRTKILEIRRPEKEDTFWCFTADDKTLALGHANGSFTLWSIPAGKKLAEIPAHRGPVTALAFSHDGETLVTGSSDGTILKWPAKAWRGK